MRLMRAAFAWGVAGLCALFALVSADLAASAEAVDLEIAVVGPMSGDFAGYGEQMRQGAQLAVEDINAKGGFGGRKVLLHVLDDEGDPKKALAVAAKLKKQGVRFVVGHYNSGASIPASDTYAKRNTLMVSPASTNPMLTERKLWNVIRTSGRDDVQGTFAGEYIAQHLSERKVAIVSDGTPYGQGLAVNASKALKAAKKPAKLSTEVKYNQTKFSDLVARMKKSGIEVVFFAGLGDQFGALIRQASEAGLKMQFVSGDGSMVRGLPEIAGSGIEGTMILFSPDDRDNPAAKDVVARFRSRGFEPADYTLKTYAAVQVIAEGAKRGGLNAPRAVASAIKTGAPIPTVVGDLTFDSKGDRRERDIAIYVWTKGAAGYTLELMK